MTGTDEELVALIREARAGVEAATARGDAAGVRRHRQRLVDLKGRLWQRLEPGIRQTARGFRRWAGRAGHDTDDLVQLGYLEMERVLDRYDPARGVPLAAWLRYVVLPNLYIGLGRKRWEEARPDLDFVAGRGPSESSGVLAGLLAREALDDLLPGDGRRGLKLALFVRHWLEGYTLAELARQEGLGVSTVHGMLNEVRAALIRRRYAEAPTSCAARAV